MLNGSRHGADRANDAHRDLPQRKSDVHGFRGTLRLPTMF
jgi:hypothetical protein